MIPPIYLAAPEWLLLIPVAAFASWYWRRPNIRSVWRVALLLVIVLALCEPRIRGAARGLDVWALVDRSASAANMLEPHIEEIRQLLERSRGSDDRLFVVDFADQVQLRGDTDTEVLAGSREETRLASAIQFALSSMESGRAARLLVVTDGYSTEPLSGLADRLTRQRVALDVRLATQTATADWAVAALRMPTRVQVGEPFEIEVVVTGAPDDSVPFTLLRHGQTVTTAIATVRNGHGSERFTDRLSHAGAVRYEAVLSNGGAHPGNDRAATWIEVAGGPRIVLVTAYIEDPLVKVLSDQDYTVDVVDNPRELNIGLLAGARAVLLNNVPAHSIPADALAAVEQFVTTQGGGLLMAGGKFSFGAGGYFQSPIDKLLPVSMELKEDHRQRSVAMAIVMDRSGSMAAPVAGGRCKMDLANEGAARSIELLGPMDSVCVFAVDSEAHEILPLTAVADARSLTDRVGRIQSTGGGIYVYTGLKAAWSTLRSAPHGQRHVILFADAADAEEPGDYVSLIDDMVREHVTVSVIGLGSENDSDAAFLEDVARRGNGRIFFNADPQSLPAIFAQETVAVARSAFLDDPVGVTTTADWLEVSDRPLQGLTSVDGYNLSYLRDGATAAALSQDEYGAPLIAFWQRGAGRTAAVSFPLAGDFSATVRNWSHYGDFLQTLTRWLMGDDLPPGIGLRTRVDGTRLDLDLLFDETWETRLAQSSPEVLLAEGARGGVEALVWERLEPGRFRASKRMRPGSWYRGAAQVGKTTIPFGPITAPGGVEWAFPPERLAELHTLTQVSGGVERTDLTTIWQAPAGVADRNLQPMLLSIFAICFLIDALINQVSWRGPQVNWSRWREKIAARSVAIHRQPAAPETPHSPEVGDVVGVVAPSAGQVAVAKEPTAPESVETTASRRRTRFDQAKRGK